MILFDSGPIFGAAAANDEHHHVCVELLTGLRLARRPLLLPMTVAAEVGYMLMTRIGPHAEAEFTRGIAEGAFRIAELNRDDFRRITELVERYGDLPLGLTDASVIALAERLGIAEVATLDRRHFTAVRPHHVDALTLLPEHL